MYVSSIRNDIPFYIFFAKIFAKHRTLISLTIGLFLISACGGPPQQADENSEGPAVLLFTPDADANFGEVLTGSTYQRTVSIYNQSLTVPATNLSLSTDFSAPFSFAGGTYPGDGGSCGNELAAGGTCLLVVEVSPTTVGSLSSTATLRYFDGLADQSSDFLFAAQARDPIPGNLTFSPASGTHNFGILAIGGFSDVNYTITNTGELTSSAINFSGLSAPFTINSNSCGASLVPASSCNLSVRFAPAGAATFNDTLNISFNDGVNPQAASIDYNGEGRVAGFLTIDQGFNFDFGIINNGFSDTQILTIRNTGGGNASTISFSALTSPYSVDSNTCPATLTPGSTCTIVTRFAPTSTAAFPIAPTLNYFDGFNNQNTAVNFTGEGFANTLTLSLISPASSPSTDSSPTIRVSNTINNMRIRLYSNNLCSVQVGNTLATGTSLDLTPTVAEGTYEFHARAEDANGNLSGCSASNVPYEYDNTNPNAPGVPVLGATFTSSATQSPTFSWAHTTPFADAVDYQVGLSQNVAGGADLAGWTSKGFVTSADHTGLAMTECQSYYVSVRAIDDVGLPSAHSVSATQYRYDSAVPTTPSSLNESDDASDTNSATVSWNASTDACGISHYLVAVGSDTNGNNMLDDSERQNVAIFTNVGNITSHRFNGLPTLTTGINHYTSIQAVDTTGRVSGTAVSDPWIIYNPAIELPDMVLWLDSNDPATILDADGDDANSGAAFSGVLATWLDKSGSTNDHDFVISSGSTGPSYDGVNFSTIYNGTTTGLTVPDHPELNNSTVTQRNLTTAFRTSGDVTSRQVIYDEGGSIRGMNIYIFNGRLYCGFYNTPNDGDGSQPFVSVNTPATANTTYFVTWVFDYTNYVNAGGPDGSLTCYVNDAVIGTATSTSRLFAHSGNIGLGHIDNQSCFEDSSCPSDDMHFNGQLYEVMIFNNVPTAGDVTNVHTFLSNKWN